MYDMYNCTHLQTMNYWYFRECGHRYSQKRVKLQILIV